jgi:hypothetical protein
MISLVAVLVTKFIHNFQLLNLEMGSHGRDVIEQSWLSDFFYWLAKKQLRNEM